MFAGINRNLLGLQTLKEKIKSGADFIPRIWGVFEPREQAPEGWLDSVSAYFLLSTDWHLTILCIHEEKCGHPDLNFLTCKRLTWSRKSGVCRTSMASSGPSTSSSLENKEVYVGLTPLRAESVAKAVNEMRF